MSLSSKWLLKFHRKRCKEIHIQIKKKINTGRFNCNNYSNRLLEVPREVVDSLRPDNFESKPTRKSVLAKHKY